MIGGQRNVSLIENGIDRSQRKWNFFPKIVRKKLKEGKLIEAIDQRLVYVALWCIQEKPKPKPNMAQVVEMLEGHVVIDEPPDTQMIVVDLLSMDDDDDDGGRGADCDHRHYRLKITVIGSDVDCNPPTSTSSSFSMSVLSGR